MSGRLRRGATDALGIGPPAVVRQGQDRCLGPVIGARDQVDIVMHGTGGAAQLAHHDARDMQRRPTAAAQAGQVPASGRDTSGAIAAIARSTRPRCGGTPRRAVEAALGEVPRRVGRATRPPPGRPRSAGGSRRRPAGTNPAAPGRAPRRPPRAAAPPRGSRPRGTRPRPERRMRDRRSRVPDAGRTALGAQLSNRNSKSVTVSPAQSRASSRRVGEPRQQRDADLDRTARRLLQQDVVRPVGCAQARPRRH